MMDGFPLLFREQLRVQLKEASPDVSVCNIYLYIGNKEKAMKIDLSFTYLCIYLSNIIIHVFSIKVECN